ncbi:chaperonin Hsp60 mitochondrial precursor [Trypanosoma rangeli SC58]|uniref:Chaperonin Hsp60 mitochondrial n=1 Tax=Trypanosoma rangeli SC58 TaxID=429131 RepID=A0A061IYQ2_TRYRA|nr:chaperonin Hsp60 mitochondrial precursor [Trypanosoma rangeli SC58]
MISANMDNEIGALIGDAMQQVGKDGVITTQEGRSLHTELELVEGMSFERGYTSPYFVTNTKSQKCELDNALVFVANRKLSNVAHILPALNYAIQQKRPLLVISEDLDGEAMHTFLYNKMQGRISGCAVKAPGFGDMRINQLQDIAVFTGAQMISEDLGLSLDHNDFSDRLLGSCKRATISRDECILMEGGGSAIAVEERVQMIRDMIAAEDHEYNRERLVERLAKLSGGVAVVKVGGASEVEINEKKDRIVDALNATRAAVAEGILAGGGSALLIASVRLDAVAKDRGLPGDIRTGVNIVKKAIRLPCRCIANNAGVEGSVVVGKIMKRNDPVFGYNAQTGEYVDMFAAGIIDPMKVVKSAVVNACSVAGMMITTEAAVVEKDMFAKEKRVEDRGIEDKEKMEGLNTMRKRVNESQAPLPALSPPMKFPMKGI